MTPDIVFIQSADPIRYRQMLETTSATVVEFCRRHDCAYQAFIGLKRGFLPWHATFNRIIQLGELADAGFGGWVFHVDADAFVVDLDFDIAGYLAARMNKAAVLVRSGATDARWDINAGVAAFNLGSPQGREIVLLWREKFRSISDAEMRSMTDWAVGWNDQNLLHAVLEHHPMLLDHVAFEHPDLINSYHASFIRQILREHAPDLDHRLDILRRAVAQVMAGPGTDDAPSQHSVDLERAIVGGLYEGILGRAADGGGEHNAIENLRHRPMKEGVRWIAAGLVACDEFKGHYAGALVQ